MLQTITGGERALWKNNNFWRNKQTRINLKFRKENISKAILEIKNNTLLYDTSEIINSLFLTSKDFRFCSFSISMGSRSSIRKMSNGSTLPSIRRRN